jgi:hypothetical protein
MLSDQFIAVIDENRHVAALKDGTPTFKANRMCDGISDDHGVEGDTTPPTPMSEVPPACGELVRAHKGLEVQKCAMQTG